MAESKQDFLRKAWKHAPDGYLSPYEQLKACVLYDVLAVMGHQLPYGLRDGKPNCQWIADRLRVSGKGVKHPTRQSVKDLVDKMRGDPDWFPGKTSGVKRGPTPLLTSAKRRAIAKSMMSAKAKGSEPSYNLSLTRCPIATTNPLTDLPFSEKYIRRVFTEDCYDNSPEHPWRFQRCLQKTWIPVQVREERLAFANRELGELRPGVWYFNNLILFGPNSTIIPSGPKNAADQDQAALPSMRYISDDAKGYSRNLKGPDYAKKQAGWGDKRYRWVLALSRGRVGVTVMDEGWGEDAESMAIFVKKLPKLLDTMLGRGVPKPKVLYSDRGAGMYVPRTGQATGPYAEAVEALGFRLYGGFDNKKQPPDLADILLHETAVSHVQKRLCQTRPRKPWLETHRQFTARVQRVVKEVDKSVDLVGLCCEYPTRLRALVEKKGDRLRK